jgi:hypothetical protein
MGPQEDILTLSYRFAAAGQVGPSPEGVEILCSRFRSW